MSVDGFGVQDGRLNVDRMYVRRNTRRFVTRMSLTEEMTPVCREDVSSASEVLVITSNTHYDLCNHTN